MKCMVVIIAAMLYFNTCINNGRKNFKSPVQPAPADLEKRDTTARLSFETDIVPIFKANCSPCHFPGGKMYDRMPFDKSKTIQDHREGILRRMKEKPDGEKIRTFIETLK